MTQAAAVELKGLCKSFGGVAANAGIDVTVRSGSIHAIIGENGAGKSTAMKMLYGIYTPDSGEILVRGEKRQWRTPSDAIAAGIGMVHQHFMLAGPYTALENVMVGAEEVPTGKDRRERQRNPLLALVPKALRPVNRGAALARLERLSETYGLRGIDWNAPVETLPVGLQQRIEILKLLYREAEILILDEPTAVLTPQETQELFANLRKLRDEGKTILIITHKLKEVMNLTDRVTVFRAGKVVGEVETQDTSIEALADLMVGRKVNLTVAPPPAAELREPVLELERVTLEAESATARPLLQDFSFQVRGGEVVGIAGVEGNGQSELLQLLLHPRDFSGRVSGSIRVLGKDTRGLRTRQIHELGVGVVPEDRHRSGLLLDRPVAENFLLGLQRRKPFERRGFIDSTALGMAAGKAIEEYDVRPRSLEIAARFLSGGNQQKLIIAREFERRPRFLIAAQPTRGVDVGAIEFIHQRILDARSRGTGVLLVSSELDEILALADRIIVVCGGKITGEFARGKASEQELGIRMGGG